MLRKVRFKALCLFGAVAVLSACGQDSSEAAGSKAASAPATAKSTGTAPAAKANNWLETIAATPDGGFSIGNPDAPVKLIEFASLTCPHCRDFHEMAMPTIKGQYVATGKVYYEFRNFVLNPADYGATMLSRCQGPGAFFGLSDAFFKNQQAWIEPFTKLTEAQTASLQSMSPDDQVVTYAKLGGLDAFVRARGIPESKFRACLTDATQRGHLETIRKTAVEQYKVTGTPAFVLNGKGLEGVHSWADLEPLLKDAVK
ncbi:thioredoxin domain-containing protein [Sphingosinicella soli]|uniref:Protein-disulfide isomerase n=1 Tax=Sphingosinicella soli TaxID=333708 RepID=A0A7W7AY95_9SPHN|nr:thioredoxin domain-containing protein [Sphingosinicella soli]MBB4630611.1 protein-disulfide isomerase [Sphingosinicella soli]